MLKTQDKLKLLVLTKTESWLVIDKVERHTGLTTVYNFEVAGFHTYSVSDLGLFIHFNVS